MDSTSNKTVTLHINSPDHIIQRWIYLGYDIIFLIPNL
jgi:hypothetical protein